MPTPLGIRITELGEDYLKAVMPVDRRTHQPLGILHGGASVVLAETLGSLGSYLAIAPEKSCVGIEINANHIRSKANGWVTGTARPAAARRRERAPALVACHS